MAANNFFDYLDNEVRYMEKAVAEALMNSLLEFGASIDRVATTVEKISDASERALFRTHVATTMASLYGDYIRPIIKQYPEFDPDGRRFARK